MVLYIGEDGLWSVLVCQWPVHCVAILRPGVLCVLRGLTGRVTLLGGLLRDLGASGDPCIYLGAAIFGVAFEKHSLGGMPGFRRISETPECNEYSIFFGSRVNVPCFICDRGRLFSFVILATLPD